MRLVAPSRGWIVFISLEVPTQKGRSAVIRELSQVATGDRRHTMQPGADGTGISNELWTLGSLGTCVHGPSLSQALTSQSFLFLMPGLYSQMVPILWPPPPSAIPGWGSYHRFWQDKDMDHSRKLLTFAEGKRALEPPSVLPGSLCRLETRRLG